MFLLKKQQNRRYTQVTSRDLGISMGSIVADKDNPKMVIGTKDTKNMLTRYLTLFTFVISLYFSALTFAAEETAEQAGPTFAYFTLAPDLTTNFHTKGKKIGYLQVRIDLMVADTTHIAKLEKHEPLIRDAIIEKIGEQTEDKIKTLAGREELRKEIMDYLNSILLAETGQTLLVDLLFTKYLYQ